MRMKQCLLIFGFSLVTGTVFAMSPKIESFEISNYSSKEVIVNVEFWEGESEAIYAYMWEQEISGLKLIIQDSLYAGKIKNVLKPYNDYLNIIEYFPSVPLNESAEAYSKMYNMPFMEKMNAIFKKLEIICDDGNRVITLENLGEQIVKRRTAVGGGETAYILEIFDYDYLEARQASEW